VQNDIRFGLHVAQLMGGEVHFPSLYFHLMEKYFGIAPAHIKVWLVVGVLVYSQQTV
jgi:hypothetical protein